MPKKINLKKFDGKKMGLIVWGKDDKDENDVRVFTGTLKLKDTELYLKRREGLVPIQKEWIKRIKPVKKDLKKILLNAQFYISLSIGTLPQNKDTTSYYTLPLKWV